jgi:hypothetical protein
VSWEGHSQGRDILAGVRILRWSGLWDNLREVFSRQREQQSQKLCLPMFIAALFTIAMLWKQPRCPTIDEWIKKMWYLYTMEYYSAMKKNEMLSFAGKWMELENITLS